MKCFAVAGHIENIFRENLADHADFGRALCEDESAYLVVLLNDSAISFAGGGNQING